MIDLYSTYMIFGYIVYDNDDNISSYNIIICFCLYSYFSHS